MIKVYNNYVECDTQEEAIQAQAIIIDQMRHIPKICNDRDLFLIEHELGEHRMRELLTLLGL